MKGSYARRFGVPALVLIAALCLTACGGGGDNDDVNQARDVADQLSAAATAAARTNDSPGGAGGATTDPTPEDDDEDNNQSGSAEAVDVCALVSQDEAAETLGRDVQEGELSTAYFGAVNCTWVDVDDLGQILVEIRNGDPDLFTEYYELTEGEPVDGLGDRAKWDDIIGLEVLTSDYYVGINTINFFDEKEALRERSIALAQTILARLP